MEKGFPGMRHAAQVMLLCALLGASGALSAAEVQGIRVATTETGTRVVLDLSAPVTSKAFRLDNPARVALDLAGPGAPKSVSVAPSAPAVPVAIRPAHAPSESGRDIIIAVDAGHGGVDPGASGRRGTREKDVVLEVAKALAARINQEPGMKAVLTRDDDYFISLQESKRRARKAKDDL